MKAAALLVTVGMVVAGATATAARADASAAPRERVQNAREGSLRAAYSYRSTDGGVVGGRIRIWSRGRLIVNRRAGYFGRAGRARLISIRQLDGTGPPEVVLNLYSGGMHCCSETWIFTGKRRTTKAWGHGHAPPLRDVDGDGKPEFHGSDTGFAYAFGSFGNSRFPAKVWSYAGGRVHDVTRSFPAEVEADMAAHYATYQAALAAADAEGVRSALAAYAADGYSLGRATDAMAVVQAAVDAGEVGSGKTDADPFWEPDYIGDAAQDPRARRL